MAQVLGAAHRAPRSPEGARKPHCPRRHPAGGTLAVQGAALGARHHAPKTQARRCTKACVRLQCPHAGSARAPTGGQRHGQGGAPAAC
eukprot:1603790-Pleurochrysis_carterae.AAC.1